MPPKNLTPDRLKALRKRYKIFLLDRDMTQHRFAKEIGFPDSTITDSLKGKVKSAPCIEAISQRMREAK